MTKDLQALFHADPPDAGDLKELFCNRERELGMAIAQLRGSKARQVYAIHGTRRSGKSHFAHRLLLQVADDGLPYRCLIVNAFNRGSARAVLAETYFQFSKALLKLTPTNPAHVRERDDLLALKTRIDRDGTEYTTAAANKAGFGGELSLQGTAGVPQVASGTIGAKGNYQREDTLTLSEKHTSLSDRDVVTVLERAARLCCIETASPRFLLLIDDLDVVDLAGDEEAPASNELVNLLRPLAESPFVAVIATVSNRYIDGREKLFCDLTELGPMPGQHLREAYERRVRRFHEGEPVFNEDALRLIVASAAGRVGIFFNNCYEVHRHAGLDAQYPIGPDAINAYARWKVEVWSSNDRYAEAIKATAEAIRGGATEVDLAEDMRKTALHLGLLSPILGRAKVWAINPLFQRAFA